MGDFVNYRREEDYGERYKVLNVRLNADEARYIKDILNLTNNSASVYITMHLNSDLISLESTDECFVDIKSLIEKGRGDSRKKHHYTIRLSDDEYHAIEQLSKYWGLSKGEYVAYLIRYHRDRLIERRNKIMKKERW